MKPSIIFLILTTVPLLDILISFKTNRYPRTLPKTKIGRSLYALLITGAWVASGIAVYLQYKG